MEPVKKPESLVSCRASWARCCLQHASATWPYALRRFFCRVTRIS